MEHRGGALFAAGICRKIAIDTYEMLHIQENELKRVLKPICSLVHVRMVILDDTNSPIFQYSDTDQNTPYALPPKPAKNAECEIMQPIVSDDAVVGKLIFYPLHNNMPQTEPETFELLLLADIAAVYIATKKYIFTYYSPQFELISRYVEDHLEEDVSAEQLAGFLHVSENAVYRIVKAATGKTLGQFVLARRMALARDLLAKTTLSIGEVALRCGILDTNYFSCLFRKAHRITPSEYRSVYTVVK